MPLHHPRPALPAAALLAVALLAAACAAPRQAWRDVVRPEVLVELVPSEAELTLDGAPLGRGSHSVAVPDADRTYVFRAAAPGFEPAERAEVGAALAGARLDIVLRPEGFGSARRLDLDDGAGLSTAAALLMRAGRLGQALEYARRAVEVSPAEPRAQRTLGDASLAAGRREDAIQAYSAYLRLAPDAPDRPVVEARVERLRGDVVMPAPRR